ncbi:MAG: hypothetical protein H7A35_07780 [Planctomycetales bacterium]|nr:hypothetical protein [bacterium]UNM09952.1 MAG: hypothetical protein H7A35_07780 [Planctomycetales bacterium]
MESFQQQQEFFREHWPTMRQKLESGGVEAAISWIDYSFRDELERRVLFLFARQGMVMGEWKGKNLDACVQFADAAIAECLSQSARASDEETRNRRLDSANVASYNLAADLAWCWDDDLPREQRHYERGLKAAQECIKWRRQLKKGAWPLSMAWWAEGVHRLALKDDGAAVHSMQKALEHAVRDAAEKGLSSEEGPACAGTVLMNLGWLELAKLRSGDGAAAERLESVLANLASQEESPDEHIAADAQFYRQQLNDARRIVADWQA